MSHLLYYNSTTGAAATGQIDADGNHTTLQSYPDGAFSGGWTHINASGQATPQLRLLRAFQRDPRPDPLIGPLMHTIGRGLRGTDEKSQLDRAFEIILASHPDAPIDLLQSLVTAYEAIPVDVKTRVMSPEAATLQLDRPLQLDSLDHIVPQLGGKIMTASWVAIHPDWPFIQHIQGHSEKGHYKITLHGFNFASMAPSCIVYLRPLDGQRLDDIELQEIDGHNIVVVEGRVVNDIQIEAELPFGIPGGRYSVRTRKAPHIEQMSDWKLHNVSLHSYMVRFLTIHCDDESDPEE
jgi:hypothetical protein